MTKKTALKTIIGGAGFLAAAFLVFYHNAMIFDWLVDDGIMPRSVCWLVKKHLLAPAYTAHGLIALSYFTIAIRLCVTVKRRGQKIFNRVFLVYAGFIGWCGITHVTALLMFFYGVATLDTIALAMTAIISVIAAVTTERVAPAVVNAPDVNDVIEARRYYQEARSEFETRTVRAMVSARDAEIGQRKLNDAAEYALDLLEKSVDANNFFADKSVHRTIG